MKRDWVAVALAMAMEYLALCACLTAKWLGHEAAGWFFLGLQVGGLGMRLAHRVAP